MSRFLAEPEYKHGSTQRIGILVVNLGSPEAPTPKAVRKYLAEFLWDPRVVEVPRPLWWLILNGFILTTRPAKSAAKYAKVWTKYGSPLRIHTENQAKMLAGYFLQDGAKDLVVEYAMRYGEPSVESALLKLKAKQCNRILVVPLYPQYAASTTASVFDAVAQAMLKIRNLPEIRLLRSFHDHPAYIEAQALQLIDHWKREGIPDKLVMSFHGVPRASLDKGDPYFCECHKTARLLAEHLSLKPEQYVVTFQSRFGRAEWLQPYTEPTLRELAKKGVGTVDVICPGFVSDCLETLEEISLEGKEAFLSSGGKSFRYVPCLNERHEFIVALRTITREHISDWLSKTPATQEECLASAKQAAHFGAKQ